jgi:hypothetical protein
MQIKPRSIKPKLLSDFAPAIFDESVSITGVCINAQRVEPGDLLPVLAKTFMVKISFQKLSPMEQLLF